MKKNPMTIVKEKFESKEKLIDKLMAHLNKKEGEAKDAFKKRIGKMSNTKLLRLSERHKIT